MKRTKIAGLKWVEFKKLRPGFITPPSKLNAAAKLGLAYERRVAEYAAAFFTASKVHHGWWLYFEDIEGRGWCAPDIVVRLSKKLVLLLECKLTYTKRAAKLKMQNIYAPLLARVYPDAEIRRVQVCRNLKIWDNKEPILKSLDEVVVAVIDWEYATLNWRPL